MHERETLNVNFKINCINFSRAKISIKRIILNLDEDEKFFFFFFFSCEHIDLFLSLI